MQLLSAKISSMNPKPDELHLNAWRLFITAHATLIDTIDRELIAADCIPLHWYDVLVELVEAPAHRLRLYELADKVVLSRSGLTRLVDKLENAGLLKREPNPEDRRGYYAVLTEAGYAALRKAWPIYAAGIQNSFAVHLSDDEAEVFSRVLRKILKSRQTEE
ncbi:MAG: MarR family transcriptional regulator [Chloroflexi bacterium]|nr:MarR family transcriptional regulator [Chloroflexota bacterium]